MAGADQLGVPPFEDTAVRIAYVTTDEVNATLARRWAHTCSCELTPLLPRDLPQKGEFDAAVFDLDHLPAEFRQRVLKNLLEGPLLNPTMVHSYNLDQRQANALRARGVFVRCRLEGGLLVKLQREVCVIEAKGRALRSLTCERTRE